MTFTLVSHLREKLSELVENRVKAHAAEEHERERLAMEVRFCLNYAGQNVIDHCARRKSHALAELQSQLHPSRSGRLTLTRKCRRKNSGRTMRSYVLSLPRKERRSGESQLA